MNETKVVQSFVWSCFAAQQQLSKVYAENGLIKLSTNIEIGSFELIRDYVNQFSDSTRLSADNMSEHYKLFYMLENEIRDFVLDLMVEEKGQEWWLDCVPDVIQKNAEKNKKREISEGITLRSDREIDYINFGELGEIIKSNWDVFGGVFSNSSKLAVEKVMARLNMLRNNIAHCSPLDDDEVLRLRLTIRDWFRLME